MEDDEDAPRSVSRPTVWFGRAHVHATSRSGDPAPHDHILVANLCRIADAKGGWKALDTAAFRDVLHAATAYGRVASAAKAVELGYAIEPDDGPSGRLGHWRIAGMPEGACELFSKRAAEITAAVESKGYDTYQARQVAARRTRRAKRHAPPADLMARWLGELSAAGYEPEGLVSSVTAAAAGRGREGPAVLSNASWTPWPATSLAPPGASPSGRCSPRLTSPWQPGRCSSASTRGSCCVPSVGLAHPDAVALMGVKERGSRPMHPPS